MLEDLLLAYDLSIRLDLPYAYVTEIEYEGVLFFPRCESRVEGGEYTQTFCGTSNVAVRENRIKGPP